MTVHYWILGDWFIPRDVSVKTDVDQRTQAFRTDSTVVYFQDKDTDATIASGVLGLAASIVALIAWSYLRDPALDSQSAAVGDALLNLKLALIAIQNKRRSWILSIMTMTVSSASAALASLILHTTEVGDDEFGCWSETLSK